MNESSLNKQCTIIYNRFQESHHGYQIILALYNTYETILKVIRFQKDSFQLLYPPSISSKLHIDEDDLFSYKVQ